MSGIAQNLKDCIPSFIKRGIVQASKIPRRMTASYRVLPDFIIIGAQRCATTSIYNYLVQHPCVVPALRKEIHFFDHGFNKGLNWYRMHFPTSFYMSRVQRKRRHPLIIGEASPHYIFHPHAPERVRNIVPQVRLIAFLRNPVDRAYSHYQQKVKQGYETLSFEDAIECEEDRIGPEMERILGDKTYYSHNLHHFAYLSKGIYVDQLKRWSDLFPEKQMLIVNAERFFQNREEVFDLLMEFLDLPGWKPERRAYRKLNTGSYTKMSPETRKRLIEYFRPHNQRLYEYLAPFSCKPFKWEV